MLIPSSVRGHSGDEELLRETVLTSYPLFLWPLILPALSWSSLPRRPPAEILHYLWEFRTWGLEIYYFGGPDWKWGFESWLFWYIQWYNQLIAFVSRCKGCFSPHNSSEWSEDQVQSVTLASSKYFHSKEVHWMPIHKGREHIQHWSYQLICPGLDQKQTLSKVLQAERV